MESELEKPQARVPRELLEKMMNPGAASRVLLADGLGHPSARVPVETLRSMNVVFVRNDGWSLGTIPETTDEGYQLWKGDWAGFIDKDGYHLIEDYKCDPSKAT